MHLMPHVHITWELQCSVEEAQAGKPEAVMQRVRSLDEQVEAVIADFIGRQFPGMHLEADAE